MSATCKWCKKPIEDDTNGFCKSEYDDCWRSWVDHQQGMDQLKEDNPISQGIQKSLEIAEKHDVCVRVVPAGGEVQDDEMVLDEETFQRIEQMAKEFGESPQELIRSLIKMEWEKAKKKGKVGES